jgi:hypothetical protein
MANSISADINIKASMDVSSVDKGTKEIYKDFKELERLRDEIVSDPVDFQDMFNIDQSDIDSFNDEISDIVDSIQQLGNKSNVSSGASELDKYSGIIQSLLGKLGLTNSETMQFAKVLGATGTQALAAGAAIGALVLSIKFMHDRIKEAEDGLKELGKNLVDSGVDGIEMFVDGIGTLISSIDDLLVKMHELADEGAEIQQAYYNMFTILGDTAGNELSSFLDKLQSFDGQGLIKSSQSIIAAAGSLGVGTSDMVKATENMVMMSKDLSIIAGDFNKASDDIGNAISKGFISRSSSLYVILTKQEKDELRSLGSEVERYNYLMERSERIKGRYVQFLNTEAGKIMLLNNKYAALQANIQKLALGLYAKIAPLLSKLIDLANIALTKIMKFFNIDLTAGLSSGDNSIADSIADKIGGIGDAAEKAEDKIKKLKKQVASFDDVIQINENDDNDNLSDGLQELSDIDLTNIDGLADALSNVNDEFEQFKKLLDMGMYDSAGNWIANWIADKLENIPWDEIKSKAVEMANHLARFLNGIFREKRLFTDLGATLGEAINTAFLFLQEFAKTFNFKEFGDSLGVAWKAFWETFDTETAANALYLWFVGVIQAVGSFFETMPITTMTEKLVALIHSFFNNFTDEDKEQIAQTLVAILNDVFSAAVILFEGLAEDAPKIIEFISNMINTVATWLESGGGKEKLNKIGDAIIKVLESFKDSGLIDDIFKIINEIIDDIKLDEILTQATEIAFKLWWESLKLKLHMFWVELKAGIATAFSEFDLGGMLIALVGGGMAGLTAWATSKLPTFIEDTFGIPIEKSVNDIWEAIKKGWNDFVNFWKTGVENLGRDIKLAFEGIKTTIEGIFNNLNPFKNVNFNIPTLNLPFSRNATGGITNGASFGLVGEAGREAILPLQNHTEWMDVLASKINNNGVGNTQIVIDMSKATKPVYTRSEYLAMGDVIAEAMKVHGFVVSMNY